ncbi:MAG TPA: hypothetical protein VGP07_04165 [Polyangia bacterium]|jgi:hypothetical protein
MSKAGTTVVMGVLAALGFMSCDSNKPGGAGGTAGSAGGDAGSTNAPGGGAGGMGGTGATGGAGGAGASGGAGGNTCMLDAPATSGLDPTKRLDALTLDDKKTLCDWTARRYCGYGMSYDCGDGNSLSSQPAQDYCVANMQTTSCAATVADAEACEKDTTCDDPFPVSCNAVYICN